VGYDGRNPLLREEGLFSYKDHPSKGVEEGAQRALKAVFEALGLEQEQAPQKQKDWLTRELRNVVGWYEAERRYR